MKNVVTVLYAMVVSAVCLAQAGNDPKFVVMREKLDSIVIPRAEFREANIGDVVQFLNAMSKQHDPKKKGVDIDLMDTGNASKITLSLQGASLHKILRRVGEMAGLSVDVEADGVALRRPREVRQAAQGHDGPKFVVMREKLDSIVIPRAEFREANIGDVVQFLNAMSKQHDPKKKGVDIDLMDTGNASKITLSLQGASLHKILRRVGEMAGLSVDVEADGVALRRPREVGQ